MSEEIFSSSKEKADMSKVLGIFISQFVIVALLLCGLFAVRFFGNATYQKIKRAYDKNFLVETTVEQVLQEGKGNEI